MNTNQSKSKCDNQFSCAPQFSPCNSPPLTILTSSSSCKFDGKHPTFVANDLLYEPQIFLERACTAGTVKRDIFFYLFYCCVSPSTQLAHLRTLADIWSEARRPFPFLECTHIWSEAGRPFPFLECTRPDSGTSGIGSEGIWSFPRKLP